MKSNDCICIEEYIFYFYDRKDTYWPQVVHVSILDRKTLKNYRKCSLY